MRWCKEISNPQRVLLALSNGKLKEIKYVESLQIVHCFWIIQIGIFLGFNSAYGSTGYNSGNPPVLSNQQQNQVNYQEIQRVNEKVWSEKILIYQDQMYAGQLSSAPYTYNYAGPSNYQNPSNPNGYSTSNHQKLIISQENSGYSSTSGPFYDVNNYQSSDTQFQLYQFQPFQGQSNYGSSSSYYNPSQVQTSLFDNLKLFWSEVIKRFINPHIASFTLH